MDYEFSDRIKDLKPSAIREIFKSLTDSSVISFAAGNPSPESFPVADLARISADIYANDSTRALQYSITEGFMPLREDITKRQKERFSVGSDLDDTLVTSGGQQGIELAAKVLCNEGDSVICENPSFIGALNAFRSLGARTVGVPMEADGINTAVLEETIKKTPRVKLLYLIPTFQNPSGITMSEAKRREVYAIARRYGLIILEDNPYGELRFAGSDIPTIKSMDEDGRVIYCSSFSKILSAGMRIGFVIAPKSIVSKMVVAKQSEDVHTNIYFQILCHRYITECDLDAHIADIRALYRRKCGLMLGCLEKYLPESISFTRPEGGLFVWCTLPAEADASAFIRDAVAAKVAVVPGATFNCDVNAPSQSFRMNYSTPSDEQIEKGIAILGTVAAKYAGKRL